MRVERAWAQEGRCDDSLLPPSAGDASLLLGRQIFRPFLDKLVMMEILSYHLLALGGALLVQKSLQLFQVMALWVKPFACCPLRLEGRAVTESPIVAPCLAPPLYVLPSALISW